MYLADKMPSGSMQLLRRPQCTTSEATPCLPGPSTWQDLNYVSKQMLDAELASCCLTIKGAAQSDGESDEAEYLDKMGAITDNECSDDGVGSDDELAGAETQGCANDNGKNASCDSALGADKSYESDVSGK